MGRDKASRVPADEGPWPAGRPAVMSSVTPGQGEEEAGPVWPSEGDTSGHGEALGKPNYSPAAGGWTQRQFCRAKPLLVSSVPKNILAFLGTMVTGLRDGPQ